MGLHASQELHRQLCLEGMDRGTLGRLLRLNFVPVTDATARAAPPCLCQV